jgi:hypothetical protein
MIGDGYDEYQQLITMIQKGTNLAMDSLTGWRYDASVLRDTIVTIEKHITKEHTVEQQMQLMKAATAGKKFTVMGVII